MTETDPDARRARAAQWRETLLAAVAERGFFEDVGAEHKALYLPETGPAGRTLVVVFDNLDDTRQDSNRLPWAVDFIHSQGWSVLGFMAHGATWYRDRDVIAFFDEKKAEGFFDPFDWVVLYGTSMGGYAAAAHSAVVPGATVVAINPQATLSRRAAAWERRFRPAWRRDFDGPYGYAPDMVRRAARVWIFYDSAIWADAAHAALFQGPQVEKIRCPHMGHGMLTMWRNMGVLKPIVSACIDGTATRAEIHRLLRARHEALGYKRAVLAHLQAQGNPRRILAWCNAVMRERRGPVFMKAKRAALKALGEAE